jgi:hypothetical protein
MPQAPAGMAKPAAIRAAHARLSSLCTYTISRVPYVHTLHRRPHQHAHHMIEPVRACVRACARACAVCCVLLTARARVLHVVLAARRCWRTLTSWPVLLPEMAAYPALHIKRTAPVRWRGRLSDSDSGRCSGLAHQPARAVACLCTELRARQSSTGASKASQPTKREKTSKINPGKKGGPSGLVLVYYRGRKMPLRVRSWHCASTTSPHGPDIRSRVGL